MSGSSGASRMSFTIHGLDYGRLKKDLIRDEGNRLRPYRDTVGKLTIGVGRNLDDRGITYDESMFMLDTDINLALQDCYHVFPGWRYFSDGRKRALANMMHNLGRTKFVDFKRMIAAIAKHDWDKAADEALDSKWAKQVGKRSERVADLLRNG